MRRPRSKLFAVALRRGWVVVAAVAAVTALSVAVGKARPGETVAQAVVVVPSGASGNDPGNETQSIKLAQTYVESIPLDGGVLGYVASSIGRRVSEVSGALVVVGNPETSVLLLQYKDADHERALTAASALLTAVTGTHPRAHSVTPHSLVLVREPTVLRETTGGSSRSAIPIGVILGLCLGLVLVVAWERSDPRIDGPRELSLAAGAPATALGDVAPGNIDALLERWRRLAGDASGPHVVGLLAGTRGTEKLVGPAASELARLSETNGQMLRLASSPAPPGVDHGLVVVTGGRPGGPEAGEAVAADATVVVVAVERGARASELRSTLAVLDEFGAPPTWALLTRRTKVASADPTAEPPSR